MKLIFGSYRLSLFSRLVAGMVLCSTAAFAEIEEIIVTAEYREKSTMDTAMSISAFDIELINKLRMERSADIANQTPGLQIREMFGLTAPAITMRGVSNTDSGPATSSNVTVHSDGVVLNSTTVHGFAMFDLERVEILRGPQGTLYGRNATTGSLNFISARPTPELSGYGRFTAANHGQLRFEGAVSGPLSDTVNGRLAIIKGDMDGYVTNLVDGDEGPEADEIAVRGILDFTLGDDISVFLKAQYAEYRGDSGYFHNFLPVNAISGTPNPGPGSGLRRINQNITDRPEHVDSLDLALQIDWDLGGMILTSVTGYNDHERIYFNDDDSSEVQILSETYQDEGDQVSQELRLLSTNDGPLSWIAGLYYLEDSIDNLTRYDFTGLFGLFFGTSPLDGFGAGHNYTRDLTSYAAFGHIEYIFSDAWSAGFGLRYTRDEIDIDYFGRLCYTFVRQNDRTFANWSNITGDCDTSGAVVDSDSWDAVTGNLSIQYRPNDRTMFYGNVGKGFKGGAFHMNTSSSAEVTNLKPEKVLSYELGLKWESEARDVGLSANLFFYDYEDLHQFQVVDVSRGQGAAVLLDLMSNVPGAEVLGAEFELRYAPTERALINLGFSWADTEYTDFLQADGTDLAGNTFPHSPEFTWNGLAQYEFPLTNDWILIPQLDWTWTDAYIVNINNTTSIQVAGVNYPVEIPDNWDFNFRLSLEHVSSGITITAFIEDIGEDDGDVINHFLAPDTLGTSLTKVDRPERYGVVLSYKF